ncbi:hypothetical protein D3C76_1460450 [compost metagenome]
MEDAPHAVGPLLGKRQLAVLQVKLGTQLDQVPDAFWPLLDQHIYSVVVAEAGSGNQRVLAVVRKGILIGNNSRNAALGIAGIALGERLLGDHQHLALLCRLDGGEQAGNAGSDDNHIRLHTG